MTDTPETRYSRTADGTNLAYQVSGDGPVDVVFLGAEPDTASGRYASGACRGHLSFGLSPI